MIENELYVVKEHIFDYPLITEKDSIIDKCRTSVFLKVSSS